MASCRWYRDPSLPIPRSEITRFPHAVLEVKLSLAEGQEAPEWVQELIDSGYLTEVLPPACHHPTSIHPTSRGKQSQRGAPPNEDNYYEYMCEYGYAYLILQSAPFHLAVKRPTDAAALLKGIHECSMAASQISSLQTSSTPHIPPRPLPPPRSRDCVMVVPPFPGTAGP